jgi:exportin-5
MKVGVPGQKGCASSVFSTMDFDSEEEFLTFFHRYRAELQECIHQVTLMLPLETFEYAERCLRSVMLKETPASCTVLTPIVIEWDAVTNVLDSVLSKILNCTVRPSPSVGLNLISLCLQYENDDPLIVSFLLSSISALFVFLSMDLSCAAMLPQVLQKIFRALVFTQPGQTKVNRSRAVKNVRRHAASLMVKLAQKYPLLLMPLFDDIKNTFNTLATVPNQLSQLEVVTLQESLILVSNHFNDYNRQNEFIAEIISPVSSIWQSLGPVFADPAQFMSFIGLDKPPVEPSTEDTNGKNRSQIMRCVKLFFAITRRSQWPSDPELQSKGGFVAYYTPAGIPVQRNPAAPHFLPLLPQLMALCKTLNDVWKPQGLSALSEGYKKAHEMVEVIFLNHIKK